VTPATLYVGALYVDSGGYGTFPYLYKTTDAGATWTALPTSGPGPLDLLAIDRASPQILYARTVDAGILSPALKSTDGGERWSRLSFPGYPIDVSDLVIDPVTSTTLYAIVQYLSDGGVGQRAGVVYGSTDGGATWTPLSGPSPLPAIFMTIDPVMPTTLYAAGSGIYKSTDGGRSWAHSDAGLSNSAVAALVVDPAAPTILYAGTATAACSGARMRGRAGPPSPAA
jgi:photosystem II stability/assembly factor-like uncharacterized protein